MPTMTADRTLAHQIGDTISTCLYRVRAMSDQMPIPGGEDIEYELRIANHAVEELDHIDPAGLEDVVTGLRRRITAVAETAQRYRYLELNAAMDDVHTMLARVIVPVDL